MPDYSTGFKRHHQFRDECWREPGKHICIVIWCTGLRPVRGMRSVRYDNKLGERRERILRMLMRGSFRWMPSESSRRDKIWSAITELRTSREPRKKSIGRDTCNNYNANTKWNVPYEKRFRAFPSTKATGTVPVYISNKILLSNN